MSHLKEHDALDGVAIIGMAGRFPGAKDIDEFWQNLQEGVESITFFSDEELLAAGIEPAVLNHPDYIKARGILGEVEMFDAAFFGINPREAELIDPQQRIFLECAWTALENAGYDPENFDGSIGVYAGANLSSYLMTNVVANPDYFESFGVYPLMLGNNGAYLSTRVSYKLNLKGPSINVQTACSTSLVAIEQAYQSLLNYQCDMALAGGVSIVFPEKSGYLHHEGITSPDGHCRAFDENAQGTLFSNGAGIVVLKRLEEALADGDHIYAVIRGAALNNDGALKVGFTAPSVEGQMEVIAMAQALARIEPERISYIEAHGTATPLGDPIEITALTNIFRAGTDKKGFCAIGTVKTNVGHTENAAGVAGLIKTALALKHKLLPPSLHCEVPNPKINFAETPFYVNTTLSEWQSNGAPRRAGISSFGMGGTNAHILVEEAPVRESSQVARGGYLLPLSARTKPALEAATDNLAEYLRANPGLNLADVAYTLQVGRRAFEQRRVMVCADLDDAVQSLQQRDTKRLFSRAEEATLTSVVFMFTGQGAQYVNMGRGLYQGEGVFREQVDYCAELLRPLLELDLRELLYPPDSQIETATAQLRQTYLTQPALFVIEYALARLWRSWGIQPAAMIGHSIGEYVAACLAGVFSLDDALRLVAARGRMMQQLPGGAMLAVSLSEAETQGYLNGHLSLAAINGPAMCVVSGPTEAVEALQSQLTSQGVGCRPLHTSHAFHSAMMQPILEPFTQQVSQVRLKPPQIPFISNVTGRWITAAEATDPGYWASHLGQTVRFADGLATLFQEAGQAFLEVGPGQTLTTLARQHPLKPGGQVVLSSLRHPQQEQPDVAFILNSLGQLWLNGLAVDWTRLYAQEQQQRVPLPTYPFERRPYSLKPPKQVAHTNGHVRASTGKKSDIADWFYIPSWKRHLPLKEVDWTALPDQAAAWLIFLDNQGLGASLAAALKQKGQPVTQVQFGPQFSQLEADHYVINPHHKADYEALLAQLSPDNLPNKIMHLGSVTAPAEPASSLEWDEQTQRLGFYSLLYLTQALAKTKLTGRIELNVVSNQLQAVTGDEPLNPGKATMLGLCRVIPQEYSNIRCRSIDLELPGSSQPVPDRLLSQLMAEIMTETTQPVVAHRGSFRWVQSFEAVRLEDSPTGGVLLRERGVYWITGGLGGIGLELAKYLAQTVQAKLVLTGRSVLPPRDEWSLWLESHPEADPVSDKLRKIRALETLGAEVLVMAADSSNEPQMQAVLSAITRQFGTLNGVIHAAGVVATTPLAEIGPAQDEPQFQSKGPGLVTLAKVLQGQPLDFCLVTSSLSAILGGLGFGAYAAANCYIDAFVQAQNRISHVPWLSVNWDSWRLGMELQQSSAFEAALLEMSMTPAEGVETFKRVLSLEAGSQVLVSVSNLAARLERWVNLKPETPALQTESDASRQPRPSLANDYVAPGNPLEQRIMDIWQDILGIEQIGTHDNFFDLGGDSFLIVQIHTRLREQINRELTVEKLFQYPTISTLAKHLSQAEAEDVATQQVRERTKQQQVLAREKQLMMKKRMKQ